jgi:hypothetical protein
MKPFVNLGDGGLVFSFGWFPGMPWVGVQVQVCVPEDSVFIILNIQILKFLITVAYIKQDG